MEYKDMTFCPFYKDCADGDHCNQALTDSVKQAALLCGFPLSQFMHKPECHKG